MVSPLLQCIPSMLSVVLHIIKLFGLQVRHLINALNEATNHLPGWDEYSATGRATQLWDGKL